MLKVLSAKLMYLYVKQEFYSKVDDDICRGVVYNYPICFLAKFETVSYDIITKLIRCIEKVRHELLKEKSLRGSHLSEITSYFSNTADTACIFLSFSKST